MLRPISPVELHLQLFCATVVSVILAYAARSFGLLFCLPIRTPDGMVFLGMPVTNIELHPEPNPDCAAQAIMGVHFGLFGGQFEKCLTFFIHGLFFSVYYKNRLGLFFS